MLGNGGVGKKASGLMIQSVSHRASQGSGYSFLKYPTKSLSILTVFDLQGKGTTEDSLATSILARLVHLTGTNRKL